MPRSVVSLSERWRQAALEPYTDAPTTTDEWLRALELGADAAVRVVLEHLDQHIEGPLNSDWGPWASREVEALLREVSGDGR